MVRHFCSKFHILGWVIAASVAENMDGKDISSSGEYSGTHACCMFQEKPLDLETAIKILENVDQYRSVAYPPVKPKGGEVYLFMPQFIEEQGINSHLNLEFTDRLNVKEVFISIVFYLRPISFKGLCAHSECDDLSSCNFVIKRNYVSWISFLHSKLWKISSNGGGGESHSH